MPGPAIVEGEHPSRPGDLRTALSATYTEALDPNQQAGTETAPYWKGSDP